MFIVSSEPTRLTRRLRITLIAASLLLSTTAVFSQNDPPANVLADDISIELVHSDLPSNVMRIDHHGSLDLLYVLHRNGEISTFDRSTNTLTRIAERTQLGISEPYGFAISPQGDFFAVGNERSESGPWVTGIVKRTSLSENPPFLRAWTTVATTEPYPLAKSFNHLMSALAVSTDVAWLYVNSGSRTDHGEVQDNDGAHPGVREVPITSAILRIPSGAEGLVLKNDADSLSAGGYLFADGVRNHFDLAFGPAGNLFGVENSGDRDDSEELNWIREGHHYGFPWRIGTNDTPQQFADYNPGADPLINPNSSAARLGLFENDPGFPPRPEGVVFTDPIPNGGPDGVEYRNPSTGEYLDGAETGDPVGSFTPHKSPLGLVFDTARALAEPYTGGGFVLGWNQSDSDLLGPFQDPGEDLLHLTMTFDSLDARSYRMTSRRIADSFFMPIDAVLVDTSLFIMEMRFGGRARMWRLDFQRRQENPGSGVAVDPVEALAGGTTLDVYPNPFTDRISVSFQSDRVGPMRISLVDALGRVVRAASVPVGRSRSDLSLDTVDLPPGVYLLRLESPYSAASQFIVRAK